MAHAAAKVRDDLEYYDQVIDGEEMVLVRDPVRGSYFKYNPLQAAMLKKLDGHHTAEQITAELSVAFETEIPPEAAERFVTRARELMLLDINSYDVTPELARREVMKAVAKSGFKPRKDRAGAAPRPITPEATLFAEALRQLELGHPRAAAGYLAEILKLNPNNARAKQLYDVIQTAYIKASGGLSEFPMFVLFNPKRFLKFISRTIGGFLFSWWGVLAIIAYVIIGAYAYSLVSFNTVTLGPLDITIALTVYTFSGVFHELGHGLACQHYGGDVNEIGFTLFYYIRLAAYCDTSSSYIIQNRHDKVVIQMAGVTASLIFISTVAIILALLYPSLPIYPGLALDLVIESTMAFVTLIPLLKFDGYYAICDYFNFPNMRDRSFRLTRAWLARGLFGIQGQTETFTPKVRGWLIAYGISAFLFTTWFIWLAYSSMLSWLVEHGRVMGLVASVLLTVYLGRKMMFRPIWNGIKLLYTERKQIFSRRRTIVLLLVTAALIAPWFAPWPVLVDSEFELVPVAKVEVRAQVGGRLDEIYVTEGTRVTVGQPLAKLHNPELHARIGILEAKLEAAQHHAEQVRSGARAEELAVARTHAATEEAVVYKSYATASQARTLARSRLGTAASESQAQTEAAADAGDANAAKAAVELMENGSRAEDIRVADAEVAAIRVELERDRTDEARLVVTSPIAGTVITKHLQDKLQTMIGPGDLVLEVHDQQANIAEIKLASSAPLGELAVGDKVTLRAKGAPHGEIHTRIARLREAAQKVGEEQRVIVVTDAFTTDYPLSGMTGHARIYGEERSLAYSVLYLPIRRLIGVDLFSL